jgi:hypothetical protein
MSSSLATLRHFSFVLNCCPQSTNNKVPSFIGGQPVAHPHILHAEGLPESMQLFCRTENLEPETANKQTANSVTKPEPQGVDSSAGNSNNGALPPREDRDLSQGEPKPVAFIATTKPLNDGPQLGTTHYSCSPPCC